MTEPRAMDRLDAAMQRCSEDTGSVVVVCWPPQWRAPWWLQILCFPYAILRWLFTPLTTKKYSYSATGWTIWEQESDRDGLGFHWTNKKYASGWKRHAGVIFREGTEEVISTSELLRRLGPGVAQVIVQAIDATYEETQDLAYLAAEIEFKQAARAEILAAERRR